MKAFIFRYRLPLVWAVVLLISAVLQTFTVLDDARVTGRPITALQAIVQEGSSHLMWPLLLVAIYWLHRRFPIQQPINIIVHVLATVPVSLLHVFGMVGIRHAVFAALGTSYSYGFSLEHLLYEYRKDAMTYLIFSGAYIALSYVLRRSERPVAALPANGTIPAKAPLNRFAVRKKDREVLVSAEDIDWIEAAGNYAVLHVGSEIHEIRSSLARLESELDPAIFVRVHKSSIVNIARVREVEPWVNSDYRIHLQDGTIIALSRRYRARFEQSVPIRR